MIGMKHYLSITLLLSSTTLLANPTVDAINLLMQTNEDIHATSPLQCSEGEDPAELEACAISLCGPAETAIVAQVNDQNFFLYVQDGIKERFPELKEPVQKIYQRKKDHLKKFITKFKEKLIDGKPQIDFDQWTYQYSTYTYSTYEDFIRTETDTTKPINERMTVKVDPPKDASEAFIKGLNSYAEEKKKFTLASPNEAIRSDLYTNEEAQQMVKDLWKKTYESYRAEQAKNPDFLKGHAERFKEYENESSIESTDNWNLGNIYSSLNNLNNDILRELKQPTIDYEYQVKCTDDCKTGIKDFLTSLNYPDMLSKLEKSMEELTEEDALTNCQANLIEAALKESDNKKFMDNFPKVKKDFLEKNFANFSAHSKQAFENYLEQELNLSFARSHEETVDGFIEKLQKDTEETDPNTGESIEDLISNLLYKRDWSDKSKMDADIGACYNNGAAFAAWDAYAPAGNSNSEPDADPNKDNIFVSLFSCTHAQQGIGVMSHEMGHALSYVMSKDKLSEESKKKFLEIRKCVTDSHIDPKTLPGSLIDHSGDSLYTEEDMADVISYNAIEQNGPIFTCALLETNQAGTKFKDLSLTNKHPQDSHSSPLLRVLREAVYKKRDLSPACKQVIEKNKEKFRFKTCL